MSQQRSIEVKVGVLIITALILLSAFIVVMGGLSLEPKYTVNVDFSNPGGLKAGAPVRMAGVRIGKISAIEFRGTEPEVAQGGALIRVVATLEDQYKTAVRKDAKWFISTQGVLGEFFLAVEPGAPDSPILEDGAVVHGISPPRLDLLLSEAYELLHHAYVGITENEQKLKETFDGLHRTLQGSGRFFERNADKVDRIVDNTETFTIQANETLLAAKDKYIDNPKIDKILGNLERSAATLEQGVRPLMEDTQSLVTDLSRASQALASQDQLARYRQITEDATVVAKQAREAAAGANALIARVRAGRGSAGAFVMDEGVYDDLQEFLRDIKTNPWKLFWKE